MQNFASSRKATQQFFREIFVVIRFGLIGIVATAIHILMIFLLLHITSLPILFANIIAFIVAFAFSFTGHYIWTFRMPGNPKKAIRRFFLISGSAFIINSLVLASLLHSGSISPFVSSLVAVAVIPVFSFLASRFWGFAFNNIEI